MKTWWHMLRGHGVAIKLFTLDGEPINGTSNGVHYRKYAVCSCGARWPV